MYPLLTNRAGHRGSLNLLNKAMYALIGHLPIRTEPKLPICPSPERTDMKIWSLIRRQSSLSPGTRHNTAQTGTQQNTASLMNSNHLPLIPAPKAGKYFDLVSCLSSSGGGVLIRNNGDTVCLSADHFKGKYVLVCCFNLPLQVETDLFQALVDRCSELYSTRDDFELVMVAGSPSRSVFDRFFSRFPKSCLAVPYEHSKQRGSICKLLDLDSTPPDGFQRLLLDKEGIVAPPVNLLSVFLHYKVEEWQCKMEETNTITLGSFLRDSEFGAVYKLNPGGDPREEVAISDLRFDDKTVGVYLCCDASFLDELVKIYKQCKEKKVDFNVVVVFMYNHSFQDYMESLLLEHDVCLQEWWCFPYEEAVRKKLLELRGNDCTDGVIVTGPLVECGIECEAGYVMAYYGIDAYPFSREAAVEALVKKLQNLRMESFLGSSRLFRGNDRDDVTCVEGLRGKKIILQVDSLYMDHHAKEKLDRLVPFYREMKAAFGGGFEIVVIQNSDSEISRKTQGEIPWYVCPHTKTLSDWAWNLSMDLQKPDHAFYGFDEDGRLCAVLDYDTIFAYGEDLIRDFQPADDFMLACAQEAVLGYNSHFCTHNLW